MCSQLQKFYTRIQNWTKSFVSHFSILWRHNTRLVREIHSFKSQPSMHIGKKKRKILWSLMLGDHFPHSIASKILELIISLWDHRSPFPFKNYLVNVPAPNIIPLLSCFLISMKSKELKAFTLVPVRYPYFTWI